MDIGNTAVQKLRVLIISTVPGPNQNDFFFELSRCSNLDLKVWYMGKRGAKWHGSESDPRYPHKFLTNIVPSAEKSGLFLNPGIVWHLFTSHYDCVIVQGYYAPSNAIAMIFLSMMKKIWIFWGEMVNRSQDNSGWRYVLKKLILGNILSHSATLILVVGGESARASYLKFGCHSDNIASLPYSCNLEHYFQLSDDQLELLSKLRHLYTSCHEKVIFSLAQLIPRKCIHILIQAFIKLNPVENNLRLLIGGDGPEKDNLKSLVPQTLQDKVSFLGFLPKKDQPAYYNLADLFVLPSKEDGWGMVIIEALASGTPVVTTTGVLSSSELIRDGINGFVVEPENVNQLLQALEKGLVLAESIDQHAIRENAKICDSRVAARNLEYILLKKIG